MRFFFVDIDRVSNTHYDLNVISSEKRFSIYTSHYIFYFIYSIIEFLYFRFFVFKNVNFLRKFLYKFIIYIAISNNFVFKNNFRNNFMNRNCLK